MVSATRIRFRTNSGRHSNVDGAALAEAKGGLVPGQTLFVVCSKRFRTVGSQRCGGLINDRDARDLNRLAELPIWRDPVA